MKVSWKYHPTNEDTLGMVYTGRQIHSAEYYKKQTEKNWIGHVHRGNSLMKIALGNRIVGKKTVDTPRVILLVV